MGTGIVYDPGRAVKRVKPADPDAANKVEPTRAYGFYHALAAEQVDPNFRADQVYSDLALPLLEQARIACLFPVEVDVVVLGLTRNTLGRPGGDGLVNRSLGADWQKIPTVALKHPLFIGAGVDDNLAAVDVALAEDVCAAGGTVEVRLYRGRDHSGAVNESLRHSIPFVRKALSGEPIRSICTPASVD